MLCSLKNLFGNKGSSMLQTGNEMGGGREEIRIVLYLTLGSFDNLTQYEQTNAQIFLHQRRAIE